MEIIRKINVIIPMAGRGKRFENEGFSIPKPLISVNGKRHLLELIAQPFPDRYWLRYNGKNSVKMPECTISKLMNEVRELIVKEVKNGLP